MLLCTCHVPCAVPPRWCCTMIPLEASFFFSVFTQNTPKPPRQRRSNRLTGQSRQQLQLQASFTRFTSVALACRLTAEKYRKIKTDSI